MFFAKQSSLTTTLRPLAGVVVTTTCMLLGGCATFTQAPGSALAQAAHDGDIPEIRRLVADGANPNHYDASGQTPLHWAARGSHPPGPHQCRGEDTTRVEVVAALLDVGADINAVDRRVAIPGASSGWTPLHVALHHEQFAIASLLLHRGANASIRSDQGRSPLAMAEDEGAPKDLLATIIAKGQ